MSRAFGVYEMSVNLFSILRRILLGVLYKTANLDPFVRLAECGSGIDIFSSKCIVWNVRRRSSAERRNSMDLNFFDDIDGMIMHERENSLKQQIDNRQRPESPFPRSTPLGMAYVPMQQWGDTSSPEDALENGSLFPELVYPFMRGGGQK